MGGQAKSNRSGQSQGRGIKANMRAAEAYVEEGRLSKVVAQVKGGLAIAKGMDAARFQVLVSSISEGSLRNQPFSTETVMALARSRAESKPCKLA